MLCSFPLEGTNGTLRRKMVEEGFEAADKLKRNGHWPRRRCRLKFCFVFCCCCCCFFFFFFFFFFLAAILFSGAEPF